MNDRIPFRSDGVEIETPSDLLSPALLPGKRFAYSKTERVGSDEKVKR